ncbi:unnamed protein product [marine sediment metagenome]|uniref:Uncharacterized protein n=1 Tax=marine sediment metagenome TaxID=412755 RepID=X0XLV4_9ZZZZ
MKITSFDIKYALMYYFRFKRQWLCASECMNNDIMAITDKDIVEVEVKISKYDLWKGEAKKRKHEYMINPSGWSLMSMPNRFYICVPIYLEEEARRWVNQINKKYGIIRYDPQFSKYDAISISKSAISLHNNIANKRIERKIMMRVCAENINWMDKK